MTTLTGGGGPATLVRSGLPIRPGAKMVPVKLVTVPGGAAGNVRMLRVSPVKGGVELLPAASAAASFLPQRNVVLNSSLMTAMAATTTGVTISAVAAAAGGEAAPGTSTSLVRYPQPV
ncbi:MAG: hypothetical protein ACK559_15470, partial [bacterium]